MIVYCALNKINGKRYIGITRHTLAERITVHCRKRNSNRATAFQSAIRKYGIHAFDISVIDDANDWKTLCEKEIYWIAFYGSVSPNGYNLTSGGDGVHGHTPETIAKMRRPRPGWKRSPEHEAKLLIAISRPHKPESIAKMRAAKLGIPRSPETIRKMSEGAKANPSRGFAGHTQVPWNKGKKGGIPWNKGKKATDEARLAQSIAAKKRWGDAEERRRQSERKTQKLLFSDVCSEMVN